MEREETQPYKCAICGEKFDTREQLEQHVQNCAQKRDEKFRGQ